MSEKTVRISLDKGMTWAGINYAPGLNDLPIAAAASAVKRKFGTLTEDSASVDDVPEDFQPVEFKEFSERLMKGDGAPEIFESLKFYQPKIKAAYEAGISPAEYIEKEAAESALMKSESKTETDADDFPEGFPSRPKNTLLKLGRTYAEVFKMTREDLIALDGVAATTADEILAFIGKK